MATERDQWPVRQKGAPSEKQVSTYGMGMQISHRLGTQEATKSCLWETEAGNRRDPEEVM